METEADNLNRNLQLVLRPQYTLTFSFKSNLEDKQILEMVEIAVNSVTKMTSNQLRDFQAICCHHRRIIANITICIITALHVEGEELPLEIVNTVLEPFTQTMWGLRSFEFNVRKNTVISFADRDMIKMTDSLHMSTNSFKMFTWIGTLKYTGEINVSNNVMDLLLNLIMDKWTNSTSAETIGSAITLRSANFFQYTSQEMTSRMLESNNIQYDIANLFSDLWENDEVKYVNNIYLLIQRFPLVVEKMNKK